MAKTRTIREEEPNVPIMKFMVQDSEGNPLTIRDIFQMSEDEVLITIKEVFIDPLKHQFGDID
jgi:hypothetical protein